MTNKLFTFFFSVVEWSAAIGSIIIIVISAIKRSFWGVIAGTLSLTFSILALTYLYYLITEKQKRKNIKEEKSILSNDPVLFFNNE